jgi:hypothetical protein
MSELPEQRCGDGIATTLACFPAGDYDDAVARWPSLAEDWHDVAHDEYCRRFQRELLRLSGHGVPMRGVAPIPLADYLPWCEEEGVDVLTGEPRCLHPHAQMSFVGSLRERCRASRPRTRPQRFAPDV